MAHFRSGSVTHPGNVRQNNEDCYLECKDYGLWLVADGMGGHEAGEVASAIVKDTVQTHMLQRANLAVAIAKAHHAVLKAVSDGIGAKGMGSTVVAVYSNSDSYEVCWVGDSRAYSWDPARAQSPLQQLSVDHSYVQMLADSGAISQEETRHHPNKNIITQCLGSSELEDVKVDHVHRHWQPQESLVLCSDGLSDELSHAEISAILQQCREPDEAAEALLKAALAKGGRDNVTVQVIESPIRNQAQRTAPETRWDAVLNKPGAAILIILLVCLVLLLLLGQ